MPQNLYAYAVGYKKTGELVTHTYGIAAPLDPVDKQRVVQYIAGEPPLALIETFTNIITVDDLFYFGRTDPDLILHYEQ
jgi:hypothetical protein